MALARRVVAHARFNAFAALGALACVLLACSLVACGSSNTPPPSRAPSAPRVVVSIAPLKGLIEPLLPPGADVQILIPPGASEHGYEPPPRALADLASADLVVLVGLGLDDRFARFVRERAPRHEAAPAPRPLVLTLADLVGAAPASAAPATPHDHGHDHAHDDHDDHAHDDHADRADHADHNHDHAGDGGDPHLWLDPTLALKFVEAAAQRLRASAIVSLTWDGLDSAAAAHVERLARLDESYRTGLAAVPSRTIIVAHAAYGWLASRYNLEMIPLTGIAAGEPSPASIARAAAALKARAAHAVFVEPQLSPQAARRLAEASGGTVRVLTLDPLGDGDYFALMERNLEALIAGLSAGDAVPADALGHPVPGGEGAPK
ncbi:MAG: metal ABC transporter substrate-binding protein [Phycisphaerales bacterium]